MLLRVAYAWRDSGCRPVYDSGGGNRFRPDSGIRSVPYPGDSAVHVIMVEPVEPVLELKDVVKYYGDTAVLDGVSFRVFRGENKIIIGASGSGKSTILKLIMGLDKPDEGKIFVDGEDITNLKEHDLVH